MYDRSGACSCSTRIPEGAQRIRDLHGRVIGWADPPREYLQADFAAIEARVAAAMDGIPPGEYRFEKMGTTGRPSANVHAQSSLSVSCARDLAARMRAATDAHVAASLVDNKHDPYRDDGRAAREDSPTGRLTQAQVYKSVGAVTGRWTSRAPVDLSGGTDEDRALAMRATQGDTAAMPLRFVAGADVKAGDMLAMRSDGRLYPSGAPPVERGPSLGDECRKVVAGTIPLAPDLACKIAYDAGVKAAREAIAAAKYDGERDHREWSVRDVAVPEWRP